MDNVIKPGIKILLRVHQYLLYHMNHHNEEIIIVPIMRLHIGTDTFTPTVGYLNLFHHTFAFHGCKSILVPYPDMTCIFLFSLYNTFRRIY